MTCIHWWLIEEANGPTSKGRCKHCGATYDKFTNSVVEWGPEERSVAAHAAYCTSLGRRILVEAGERKGAYQ